MSGKKHHSMCILCMKNKWKGNSDGMLYSKSQQQWENDWWKFFVLHDSVWPWQFFSVYRTVLSEQRFSWCFHVLVWIIPWLQMDISAFVSHIWFGFFFTFSGINFRTPCQVGTFTAKSYCFDFLTVTWQFKIFITVTVSTSGIWCPGVMRMYSVYWQTCALWLLQFVSRIVLKCE